MVKIERDTYILLLSYNPCEIFEYFGVDEMHGLNIKDCQLHVNNTEQAYLAGWCNLIPNKDKHFVFINLSRCNTEIETFANLMHELMHLAFDHYDDEEDIISWAELGALRVYPIVEEYQINLN
jgi:hypothetical protein